MLFVVLRFDKVRMCGEVDPHLLISDGVPLNGELIKAVVLDFKLASGFCFICIINDAESLQPFVLLAISQVV